MAKAVQKGWIGVDLDGTLAEYHGWQGIEHIGKPITAMIVRVKQWLSAGQVVKVFTARVNPLGRKDADVQIAREFIEQWCQRHLDQKIPVVCCKDFAMLECWDDRAVQVKHNIGNPIPGSRFMDMPVAVMPEPDERDEN